MATALLSSSGVRQGFSSFDLAFQQICGGIDNIARPPIPFDSQEVQLGFALDLWQIGQASTYLHLIA
jgi:hypothetical protein